MDALEAYQKQSRQEELDRVKKAISENKADIYNNPDSPIMGKADGDVMVVEFFDYNCAYCKSVFHPIRDAVQQDGNIKFVFKDYPILGETSVYATRAALAAAKQGKYVEFHTALMDLRAPKDEAAITTIATALGLDLVKLKNDMQSTEIEKTIFDNRKLGTQLGVNGTPAFIINDEFYPGAMDADSFKKMVADVRAKKAGAAAPAPAANPEPAK
jgi:protein-disulfide isomerase